MKQAAFDKALTEIEIAISKHSDDNLSQEELGFFHAQLYPVNPYLLPNKKHLRPLVHQLYLL